MSSFAPGRPRPTIGDTAILVGAQIGIAVLTRLMLYLLPCEKILAVFISVMLGVMIGAALFGIFEKRSGVAASVEFRDGLGMNSAIAHVVLGGVYFIAAALFFPLSLGASAPEVALMGFIVLPITGVFAFEATRRCLRIVSSSASSSKEDSESEDDLPVPGERGE